MSNKLEPFFLLPIDWPRASVPSRGGLSLMQGGDVGRGGVLPTFTASHHLIGTTTANLMQPAMQPESRTTAARATTMGPTDTHSRLARLLASSRARRRPCLLSTHCQQLPSKRGDDHDHDHDARPPKMDPVSAAANIIAIIHAANRVIVLCQKFLATVKDAPGELRLILIEVSTLWAILNQLELLVSCNGDAPVLDALGRDHGPIQGCRRVLTELENLLPPESILATESKRKALATAFGWLLKEHKAKNLLDELKQHKSTIALALTTDSS